jgi:hypothetical protein
MCAALAVAATQRRKTEDGGDQDDQDNETEAAADREGPRRIFGPEESKASARRVLRQRL